ncbi:hypothetical protein DL95DRAFT_135501 [Leptodontidium sp. 2 PMI_412]|nr:hypothetical protein DL95DRAFT_135501 [Leptodontidium sp. 2 PMI_412]
MSDEILKDLDRTMEGERLAFRRNHVEQLSKVRAESYELGFQAGRKEAVSSEAGRPKQSPVTADIGSLREQHKQELESARKAGREIAYSELSLDPDERVNFMLQHSGDLNSNRKIRELKTIHQKWNDIPQRVLPSYMLPEGHTPGDKTLYLLARLSKDVDGSAASQLLTEEIDKRCKHSSDQAKCRIVTNTDIRYVLGRINLSSLGGLASRGSMDMSQTPQPLSQDQSSAVPRSQNPDRARSGPQPKNPSKTSASKQPKESTDKKVAEIIPANHSETFAIAVEQWLDADFMPSLWYRSSSPDKRLYGAQAAQISTTSSRTLVEEFRSHNPNDMLLGGRFETIAEDVQSTAKLAGMLGKTYSTALELRTLKRYLADLTRDLVGHHLYQWPRMLHAFQIIHRIFNHYNDLHLASKAEEAAQAVTVAENIPSRNIVTTSNRPVLGKVCNAPKRPTTGFNTPTSRDAKRRRTASAVPSRAREIHRSAENRNPSVEISSSTIVVESRARKRESLVFKKDEDDEDDDLYGASPPPRVRKRLASKRVRLIFEP